jgi:hypothetical protein
MATRTCSDEKFVETWERLHSASAVAREIGVSERNVHSRRRLLQTKGHKLLTVDERRPTYDQSHMLITADRVEVKLTIANGVVIAAGDQHYWPGTVPVMHRAYVELSKRLKPYAQIWNGDAFDGASVSRHASIGWESKPTVKQELDVVNERSTEIRNAAPYAKRIWNLGNHDMRFETRIAADAPQYADVQGVHLKDHFPEWVPAWFCTINEGTPAHTEIRHREKGGIHAGYNNTKESGVTMVTGHDHTAEVRAYCDRRGMRWGVRHGMTADSARNPQFVNYLEGRLPSWQAALAVLTYRDGVLLQPELALRFDDESFQFRGEIIKV